MGTPPNAGSPAITAELVGRGTLDVGVSNVHFAFEADPAPVPEPSTLFLLATGTAVVLRRRWKHLRSARAPRIVDHEAPGTV